MSDFQHSGLKSLLPDWIIDNWMGTGAGAYGSNDVDNVMGDHSPHDGGIDVDIDCLSLRDSDVDERSDQSQQDPDGPILTPSNPGSGSDMGLDIDVEADEGEGEIAEPVLEETHLRTFHMRHVMLRSMVMQKLLMMLVMQELLMAIT